MRLQRDLSQQPIAPRVRGLDRSVKLTDDELCLKFLHNYGI